LKSHYELLGVPETADQEEIKRAFRREIARYHPDKVQHLGHEFQEIAAVRAAMLTEAYRVLMDDEARRKYDAGADPGSSPAAPAPSHTAPAAAAASRTAPEERIEPQRPDSRIQAAQATTDTFVKKAALAMLREAATSEAGGAAELPASGFDLAFVLKGKRALFGKKEPVVRLLARFVPQVDVPSINESWPLAVSAAVKDQTTCVLLLGSGIAPSAELARAISELRRKSRTAVPVLVPVDVRDWDALLPPEAPASVRSVLQKLREGRG
jgi:hypothetical protein